MLRGLDAAVEGMRLTCQADDSQYVIKWDLEQIVCGADQLGYSPAKEKSLGLSKVCVIDEDVEQSQ